jgi:hypothetical protein
MKKKLKVVQFQKSWSRVSEVGGKRTGGEGRVAGREREIEGEVTLYQNDTKTEQGQ